MRAVQMRKGVRIARVHQERTSGFVAKVLLPHMKHLTVRWYHQMLPVMRVRYEKAQRCWKEMGQRSAMVAKS